MHGGLSGGWMGGAEVDVRLLEPLQVLRVGGWRAVGIEGPPKLPVIKEGIRLVLAVHVVVRTAIAIARLLVLRKGLNICPMSLPE